MRGAVAVIDGIDNVGGETLSVAMPCDCVATPVSVAEGSTVLAGEPLVALADAEAPMVIEASLPQELLFEIQRAGTVDRPACRFQRIERALGLLAARQATQFKRAEGDQEEDAGRNEKEPFSGRHGGGASPGTTREARRVIRDKSTRHAVAGLGSGCPSTRRIP